MLLTLALSAHASRIMQPGDHVSVSSPYGSIPKYTARSLCGSQYVFIGVVQTATSRYTEDDRVVTDLQFHVERALYGEPGPTVLLTIPGGEIDGRVVTSSGARYLMAYSLLKQSTGLHQAGDPILTGHLEIPPPTAPELGLRLELDTFCQDHGLPRYHQMVPR